MALLFLCGGIRNKIIYKFFVLKKCSKNICRILFFYFFIFRAKKTQDKKRTSMLDQLKPGDRVQTIGGILGTVIKASDSEVTLKVDETSNTKLRFARSAIHRVLGDEVEAKEK